MASFESDGDCPATRIVPETLLSQTDAYGRRTAPIRDSKARCLYRLFSCLCICSQTHYSVNPLKFEDKEEGLLLPPQSSKNSGRKTLVLDLDETLVHSSLLPIEKPDLSFAVPVGDTSIQVYIRVRPGVSELLSFAAKYYELVVYTASVQSYADPLLDILDTERVAMRLFRHQCRLNGSVYVKDLERLGRSMEGVILVDVRDS